jgi:hypothetical protein
VFEARQMRGNTTEENREDSSEADMRRIVFMKNNQYIIQYVALSSTSHSIIILYSSPRLLSKYFKKQSTKCLTMLKARPRLAY